MNQKQEMSDQDFRWIAMVVWNATVIFVALYYLGLGVIKPMIVALFVLISSALGYGARWLHKMGFAVAILAIFVASGFPHPSTWSQIVKAVPAMIQDIRGFAGVHTDKN